MLIKFELKKLWRSRLYVITLILTIAFVLGFFIRNIVYQDINKAEEIARFQGYRSDVLSQIIYQTDLLREIAEGVDVNLEESLKVGRALYHALGDLVEARERDQELALLQLEIDALELAIIYQDLDNYFPLSLEELTDEVEKNTKLISVSLPKEPEHASIQPAVFLRQIASFFFTGFSFYVVITVIGTPIVKEYDDYSIKLTYSLPLSSRRLILSKWASLVISGAIWLSTVICSALIVSTLFGKQVDQPFNYLFRTAQQDFIRADHYTYQIILFGFLFILLLTALVVLLTLLVKRSRVVQLLTLVLFLSVEVMLRQGLINVTFPFTYQNLDLAITHFAPISINGLAMIISNVFVILGLAMLIDKRRRYLC
ncbi:ABC-2 type transport system permease protein [Amphibacillus marinus]|uniref:ABC-2 type transport system permease protein n=1 Tax=Amphibacillus marinus TaxID=872970 RepID=A0A1H8KGT4_9BACI|nr:ABC transporter permease subunit [Amphibacillus marinus]SEN92094.1 ABC-2 type transport system permease protein [Amphibacillus marinus]